jgi:hypothetical protein
MISETILYVGADVAQDTIAFCDPPHQSPALASGVASMPFDSSRSATLDRCYCFAFLSGVKLHQKTQRERPLPP